VCRVYAARILTGGRNTRQSIVSEPEVQVRGIAASVTNRVIPLVSH
jgi:hypothetical protein